MKIRVINENDWEKAYEFEKTIIRVGNQPSCDIQLKEAGIQPLQFQLIQASTSQTGYVMRIFADNVTVTRGEQIFTASKMTPYDVLDGDMLSFGSYRVVISLESGKTRIRQSAHIEAEMILSRRDLSPDSPINGILVLKNIGSEKPCQFRMHMSGIPADCLQSSPLPYIYPGGSSSVGFIISHLQTRPEPGFHTVSISLNAPDDYVGETLEFNQDIYVAPVFHNEFVLEDDSAELSGIKTEHSLLPDKPARTEFDPLSVRDSALLIGMEDSEEGTSVNRDPAPSVPVVVDGSKDFIDEDPEEGATEKSKPRRSGRRPAIVVRNDADAFGEDGAKADDETEAGPAADSVGEKHDPETAAPENESADAAPEPAENADPDAAAVGSDADQAESGIEMLESDLTISDEKMKEIEDPGSESGYSVPEKPDVPEEKPDKKGLHRLFSHPVTVFRNNSKGFDEEAETEPEKIAAEEPDVQEAVIDETEEPEEAAAEEPVIPGFATEETEEAVTEPEETAVSEEPAEGTKEPETEPEETASAEKPDNKELHRLFSHPVTVFRSNSKGFDEEAETEPEKIAAEEADVPEAVIEETEESEEAAAEEPVIPEYATEAAEEQETEPEKIAVPEELAEEAEEAEAEPEETAVPEEQTEEAEEPEAEPEETVAPEETTEEAEEAETEPEENAVPEEPAEEREEPEAEPEKTVVPEEPAEEAGEAETGPEETAVPEEPAEEAEEAEAEPEETAVPEEPTEEAEEPEAEPEETAVPEEPAEEAEEAETEPEETAPEEPAEEAEEAETEPEENAVPEEPIEEAEEAETEQEENAVPEEPVEEAEEAETEPETAAAEQTPAKDVNPVLRSGSAAIPVIHNSKSFDFSDEDDTEPAEDVQQKDQPPAVRFVKGGQFDE